MSEYQSHEFIAVDRPLTSKQIAELRTISSRAEITSTRFRNEYNWGDLKADPARLVARYFDAYAYYANWGTRRLMLRMPGVSVDAKALRAYFADAACVKAVGPHLIVDVVVEQGESDDDESPPSLDVLAPLRSELMLGDLRGAYLAWLLAVQQGDVAETEMEPPVPAGLAQLSAAQAAMVDFLQVDEDLLAVAAEGSSPVTDDRARVRAWTRALAPRTKDAWLQRAIENPDLALGAELIRAFRAEVHARAKPTRAERRRTVAELLEAVDRRRARRERAAAGRATRAARAAEAERNRRLDHLAARPRQAWLELETLVVARAHDRALELAIDLRDIATRAGDRAGFLATFEELRRKHRASRGFFDRWKRANEASMKPAES